MALETFDNGGSLDHVAGITEHQKAQARETVCVSMESVGCTSAEIAEVFDMLGIWPEGMRRE
jgi:hypothetical protein